MPWVMVAGIGAMFWFSRQSHWAKYRRLAQIHGLKPRFSLTRGFVLAGRPRLVELELTIGAERSDNQGPGVLLRARLPTRGRLEAMLIPSALSTLNLPVWKLPVAFDAKLAGRDFRAWVTPEEVGKEFLLGPKGPGRVFGGSSPPQWVRFTATHVEFSFKDVPSERRIGELLEKAEKLAIAAADV